MPIRTACENKAALADRRARKSTGKEKKRGGKRKHFSEVARGSTSATGLLHGGCATRKRRGVIRHKRSVKKIS